MLPRGGAFDTVAHLAVSNETKAEWIRFCLPLAVPPSGVLVMNAANGASPVVIYVNGASAADPVTIGAGQANGPSSSPQRSYDPYEVHREFPSRWQAYIQANFRNIGHVTSVFNVSERTARNWWKGDFGAVGGHVAIAIREHGQIAYQMLFGEAA